MFAGSILMTPEPSLEAPQQAVILLDCPASRRQPVRDEPPALAMVGGRPFLHYLLETCVRFGFDDVTLVCASAWRDRYANFAATTATMLRAGTRIAIETRHEGGGDLAALRHMRARLADRFLLLDGQSLFDFNWLDLMVGSGSSPPLVLAARPKAGEAKTEEAEDAASVLLVARKVLDQLSGREDLPFGSLLRACGLTIGRAYDAPWIDIGAPGGLDRAEAELPRWRQRAAVFFDRDGTVNVEVNYAFRPDQLAFMPGAIAAIKRVNDSGRYAFLVTNQSGIARGYYKVADMELFHATMQRRLRAAGAHFDDIRYCPHHPQGIVPEFAHESDWRKPAPGMFLDLLRCWPVIREKSLAVGDMDRDVHAAEAAGVRALHYRGGDLDAFLAPHLAAE
jgi:D,D-heptose 1,7-bisphosphate phosphatase